MIQSGDGPQKFSTGLDMLASPATWKSYEVSSCFLDFGDGEFTREGLAQNVQSVCWLWLSNMKGSVGECEAGSIIQM